MGGKKFLALLLGVTLIFGSLSEAGAVLAAGSSPLAGTPYQANGDYSVAVPHIVINQVYGGGTKAATDTYASHGFIELYNPTSGDVDLTGWSLQYAYAPASGVSTPWVKLNLTGTIKAYSSYLIIGAATGATSPTVNLSGKYDQVLVDDSNNPVFINNKGLKVALISNTDLLTVKQPFSPMVEGYVDMLGAAGNDDGNLIDGYENDYRTGKSEGANSKKIGLRRVNFADTDHNKLDFELVDYSAASLNGKGPRYSGDGAWGQGPGITTAALTGGSVGNAYSAIIAASGGTPPYTFAATGLPSGLSIEAATGAIAGTPVAAGKSTVSVTVTDSATATATREYTLNIQGAPIADTLNVTKIGQYNVGTSNKDGGVAEIVKYNKDNGKMYVVNGSGTPPSLDIVALTNSAVLTKEKSVLVKTLSETGGFVYGDLTSVDVNTKTTRVAVAVQEADPLKMGKILVFDYSGNLLATYATGVQPDMVKYTSDGKYILTADEGEPRTAAGDPEGSVTIVDTTTGVSTQVKFDNPAVIDDLVHIRGASDPVTGMITGSGSKADAVFDFEPEYIALNANETLAYVALQENNAIATIDIATKTVVSVKGLGYKNFNDPKNALDLVKDNTIDLENVPFFGMYMPDGIASYSVNGTQYLLTANEGDATEWPDGSKTPHRKSATTIGALKSQLTPGSDIANFLGATTRYDNVEVVSDMPKDGIYMYGGRSFSIWNAATLAQVYDSGSDFETITAQRLPEYFNASNSKTDMDDRSAKKGPEPEYVTVGQAGDKTYAFIGLERIGGVMTYDVTNPENPVFANYINTRDFTKGLNTDTGPEGLEFIPAQDSPTGYPLLLVANEVGGTIAVLQLDVGKEPITWPLTVMHTNDTHAHLADVARRATLVNQVRNEGGNSLLLDAGDVFSGDLYFTKWAGLADVAFMNYMGYDAMTFGNHEFDSGTAVLADFIKAAKFPLLTSNIDFSQDGNISPLLKPATTINTHDAKTTDVAGVYPYVILEVNGHKVGVFGMTTEDTAETSSPGKNVKFNDATASASATVSAIEAEGVNVIIALSHLGYNRDKALAVAVNGIDLIVGGHTHTKLDAPEVVSGAESEPTVIVQANEWGKFLGRVDLVFNDEGVVQTNRLSGSLLTVNDAVEEDAAARDMLKPYNDELEQLKTQVIGATTVKLNGERSDVRAKETNFGNFIADSLLYKAKLLKNADIALINGGGVRESIDPGDITMGQLRKVMPFGNTLFVLDVTGQQLKAGLENGVSGAKLADLPGKFPQVAGMRFKWDPNQPVGSKVYDIEIQTASGYVPLNLTSTYRMATNSFVALGGDGYVSFAEAIENGAYHEDLGYPDYEIFIEYVTGKGGTIAPVVEGRIIEKAKSTGNGGGSNTGGNKPTSPEPNGTLSGDQLDIKQQTNADGQSVNQVTVGAEQLQAALAKAAADAGANKPAALLIDLSKLHGATEITLPAAALKAGSGNAGSLMIKVDTAEGSYSLPLSVLNLSGNSALDGTSVRVAIAPVSEETLRSVRSKAEALGAQLTGDIALSFEVYIVAGTQEHELNDFGTTFVSRTIYLPAATDTSNATVVMVDPISGQLRFVPQLVTTVNGKPAIEIKRTGNSVYAIINNRKQFADLKRHWATSEIETLASKLIVKGINDTDFAPDRPITRAEFTSLLVRSLGLAPSPAASSFQDIASQAWYAGEVEAAVKFGLASGRETGKFAPSANITRAEMAVMIARAVSVVNPSETAGSSAALARFTDAKSIPQWAAAQAALLADKGIMQGDTNGAFAPSALATRAQAAVMLQRTLTYLKLLN